MERGSIVSEILICEIAERLARLRIYVDVSLSKTTSISSTLKNQAQSVKDSAESFFQKAYSAFHNNQDNESSKLKNLFEMLKYVPYLEQTACVVLPFQDAPPEIKRFLRFLERNVLAQQEPRLQLHLAVAKLPINSSTTRTEEMISHLQRLVIPSLPGVALDTTAHSGDTVPAKEQSVSIEFSSHDCANPTRWPIAIHELGHHIYALIQEPNSFLAFFRAHLNISPSVDLPEYFNLEGLVDIESWLKEIWCDCLAAYLLGPVVFFSQFQTFIRSTEHAGSVTHPSAGMRLYILDTFLAHRHGRTFPQSQSEIYVDTIILKEIGGDLNIGTNPKVTALTNVVTKCILGYFPQTNGEVKTPMAQAYNENLLRVISTTGKLNMVTVNTLTSILEDGLPIPSIGGNGSDLRATTLEEIFYAGWRCCQKKLFLMVCLPTENSVEGVLAKCESSIRVTDERILSSLQVSEWVRGLISELEDRNLVTEDPPDTKMDYSVLGFSEIAHEITKKHFRVIPLIDGKSQIGRCSIDLRLGTSFELLSDSKSSIDFLSDDSILDRFTTHHELDYGEPITISPGQFVIGHTMEYLQVPNYLCGQVDGRSSFARVGLLIHLTAGFLEPGYNGSITLEIYNIGTAPIVLYPGYRICQLRLMPVGHIPSKMFAPKRYEQQYGFNRTRKSLDVEISAIGRLLSKKTKPIFPATL